MSKVSKIYTASVKARIGGCDERGVIAEADNGKIYCVFHMGAAHGFKRIAAGYATDIGREIESFEKAFEVEKRVSRKGREYFEAKQNQY